MQTSLKKTRRYARSSRQRKSAVQAEFGSRELGFPRRREQGRGDVPATGTDGLRRRRFVDDLEGGPRPTLVSWAAPHPFPWWGSIDLIGNKVFGPHEPYFSRGFRARNLIPDKV